MPLASTLPRIPCSDCRPALVRVATGPERSKAWISPVSDDSVAPEPKPEAVTSVRPAASTTMPRGACTVRSIDALCIGIGCQVPSER